MIEIIAKPFDWNENMSEIALQDFSQIQKRLSYCTAQTIGMALAKLELLEKQGCKVKESKESDAENLCDSCKTKGCIFQSGIVRSHCDFYKAESEE